MDGLLKDTIAELRDRKIWWLYLILLLLAVLAIVGLTGVDIGSASDDIGMRVGFDQMAAMAAVRGLGSYAALLLFVSVMATAGVIQGTLGRGKAEFYLSKPISRVSLYLKKLLAVWIVYGALVMVSLIVAALVLKLAFPFVSLGSLWIAVFCLPALFVWLSITMVTSLASRSFTWPAAVAVFVFFAQYILQGRDFALEIADNRVADVVVPGLYYIQGVESWLPLWSTVLFGLAMCWLASLLIGRKDY
jgi:ABC-type transport system involved in multi-copper enzyme maturation permease subunit